MIIEKRKLKIHSESAYYVHYRLDNSPELDENKRRPAMVVCPGGGYLFTSDREAEPVAMHFLNLGYHVFVLRYVTADKGNAEYPNSLYDLAELMAEIYNHQEEWGIAPEQTGIIGFSAGGHLCASLAVHWQDAFLCEKIGISSEALRPAAVILGYPLLDFQVQKEKVEIQKQEKGDDPIIQQMHAFMEEANVALLGKDYTEERMDEVNPVNYVTDKVPPVFLWHTAEDGLVFPANSLRFAAELEKNKVPFELHIFEKGDHGMSLATATTSRNESEMLPEVREWTKLAASFLNRHMPV